MTILICAIIGALIAMLIGWMLQPAPAPRMMHVRAAMIHGNLIIGVKIDDDVTFYHFNG